MQELKCVNQYRLQCPQCRILRNSVIRIIKSRFHHLNIPVTELVPDKVINLLDSDAKLEAFHIVCDLFDKTVQLGNNPAIHRLKGIQRLRDLFTLHIHHDKP